MSCPSRTRFNISRYKNFDEASVIKFQRLRKSSLSGERFEALLRIAGKRRPSLTNTISSFLFILYNVFISLLTVLNRIPGVTGPPLLQHPCIPLAGKLTFQIFWLYLSYI